MTVIASSIARPTYGELISDATGLMERAIRDGCGPFADAESAATEIYGYRRFVGVAGRHLRLVLAPGHVESFPARDIRSSSVHGSLLKLLTPLPLDAPPNGRWRAASDRLAVVHDLLTTHLGPGGEQRTPEGSLVAQPEHSAAAIDRIVDLIHGAALAGPGLARHALRAAREGRPTHRDWYAIQGVSRLVPPLDELAAAAFEQIRHASARQSLDAVDGLTVAIRPGVGLDSDDAFEAALAAMRTLRGHVFEQSKGLTQASFSSLYDLTRVGVEVTRQSSRSATDSVLTALEQAGRDWTRTQQLFGPHLRGLDRAPRTYAHSVKILLGPAGTGLTETVTRSMLSALPELATGASDTIQSLAARGRLARAVKTPASHHVEWRPIAFSEAVPIADAFNEAARSSARAEAAVANLAPAASGSTVAHLIDLGSGRRRSAASPIRTSPRTRRGLTAGGAAS